MATENRFEYGCEILGNYTATATWRRLKKDYEIGSKYAPSVMIFCSSVSEDGVFIPASEIILVGAEALRALRKTIDEALKNSKDE